MKRLLSLILCTVLLVAAAVSVNAAVTYSDKAPAGLGTLVIQKGASKGEITESNGSVVNLSDNGTSFCPKANCWVRYEFKADKDGTYTFVIEYIARPDTNRGVDYAIDATDASKRVLLDLDQSADKRYAAVTEELKAGTHSFYFFCPTGFDDSTLKSCDVYGLSVYLTKEAVAVVTPPVTKTPDTGDITVVAIVAFLVCTAALVVLKVKKHR